MCPLNKVLMWENTSSVQGELVYMVQNSENFDTMMEQHERIAQLFLWLLTTTFFFPSFLYVINFLFEYAFCKLRNRIWNSILIIVSSLSQNRISKVNESILLLLPHCHVTYINNWNICINGKLAWISARRSESSHYCFWSIGFQVSDYF